VAGVAAWLDDVAAGHGARPGGRLAAALDARFPAGDVERWLPGHSDEPAAGAPGSDERHSRRTGSARQEGDTVAGAVVGDDVRQRALAALAALPLPVTAPAADAPDEWIAAAGAPAARSAFVARATALVGGMPGRALLLNLVGCPDDVSELRHPESPLAVLMDTADRALARPVALAPVVEAKKAPDPPARGAGVVAVAGIAVLPLVVLFVLLATTAVIVTLVFWLL
jgi:hypothetical protein